MNMISRLSSVVKRHPIISFFVLTFVLSWWPWPLYAMGVPWAISPLLPGPLLAALIVIPITQGWAGLRELGSRMIRWRVGWRWYALALGIPLAVAVAAVALSVALGAPAPSLASLPALTAILMVFGIKLINPLNGPMGEEPGWRGVALPGLQGSGLSPLLATLILAPLVALWHVPLVFAHEISPVGLLGAFTFTFVATWVFNHTGGSVFMTLVMHAAEGTFGLLAGVGFAGAALAQLPWVYVGVWFVVAIGLVIFDWKAWRGPAATKATTVPPAVPMVPKPV
jgi:membrane protease YdiL (CAAX protease family)